MCEDRRRRSLLLGNLQNLLYDSSASWRVVALSIMSMGRSENIGPQSSKRYLDVLWKDKINCDKSWMLLSITILFLISYILIFQILFLFHSILMYNCFKLYQYLYTHFINSFFIKKFCIFLKIPKFFTVICSVLSDSM